MVEQNNNKKKITKAIILINEICSNCSNISCPYNSKNTGTTSGFNTCLLYQKMTISKNEK